jgi:hypothetical protein
VRDGLVKDGFGESFFIRIRPEEKGGAGADKGRCEEEGWGEVPDKRVLEVPSTGKGVLGDDNGDVRPPHLRTAEEISMKCYTGRGVVSIPTLS